MTAYLASRDVMARRNADWHEKYTLPSLWDFYQPSRVEPRLVLLRLDELGRGGVAQLLPRVDGVPQRLQEHGRPGHGQLRRRLHLQHVRLLDDRGDGAAAGGGLPSARGDPRRDAARAPRRCYEPKGKPIEFGVVRAGLLADLDRRARESGRQPQGALRDGRACA